MSRSLRSIVVATAALVATLALGATAALADSPHYIGTPSASIDTSTGNLLCSFKEAGLGTSVNVTDVTCTASVTAVYQCWNNGGNHPKAGNKETVSGIVSNTQTFPVRNGQTTGTVIVGPPSPGDFTCPNGQSLFLEDVTYSNIQVISEAGTVSTSPSTVSKTGLHLAV
jgi:hypothetical protein